VHRMRKGRSYSFKRVMNYLVSRYKCSHVEEEGSPFNCSSSTDNFLLNLRYTILCCPDLEGL
jgi:hypothetical protein